MRRRRGTRLLALIHHIRVPGEPVDHIEQRKQETAREQHGQQHGLERPQKIDALEEPRNSGGSSERRERAADIGDQEDEEHEDVDVVGAILIRPVSSGGSAPSMRRSCRESSPKSADGEDRRVGGRRADEIAADADAARHHEQSEQQEDERQIIEQEGVQRLGARR